MSKRRLVIFGVLALLAAAPAPLSAQEPAPTPEELTLRPGDRITWTVTGVHRLRFGGTVTHNGAELKLTPFTDVQKVLTGIDPPVTPDADGVATWPAGTPVTATVKADTSSPAVSSFFFTCGFPQHVNGMVTQSFTISTQASSTTRNVQIVSSNNMPHRWILKGPPDKKLTRP